MTLLLLSACIEGPRLVETTSVLLAPGDTSLSMLFEGPGWLVSQECDGYGLALDVGPGDSWPYVLDEGELVDIWVTAELDADGGERWCSVWLGSRTDNVSITVVVL